MSHEQARTQVVQLERVLTSEPEGLDAAERALNEALQRLAEQAEALNTPGTSAVAEPGGPTAR